jgi:hypothetical protein
MGSLAPTNYHDELGLGLDLNLRAGIARVWLRRAEYRGYE